MDRFRRWFAIAIMLAGTGVRPAFAGQVAFAPHTRHAHEYLPLRRSARRARRAHCARRLTHPELAGSERIDVARQRPAQECGLAPPTRGRSGSDRSRRRIPRTPTCTCSWSAESGPAAANHLRTAVAEKDRVMMAGWWDATLTRHARWAAPRNQTAARGRAIATTKELRT